MAKVHYPKLVMLLYGKNGMLERAAFDYGRLEITKKWERKNELEMTF